MCVPSPSCRVRSLSYSWNCHHRWLPRIASFLRSFPPEHHHGPALLSMDRYICQLLLPQGRLSLLLPSRLRIFRLLFLVGRFPTQMASATTEILLISKMYLNPWPLSWAPRPYIHLSPGTSHLCVPQMSKISPSLSLSPAWPSLPPGFSVLV